MSAPFRPAAWTRTRISPRWGSGSGCCSTTTEPSRMVAARIDGHPSCGGIGDTAVRFVVEYRRAGYTPGNGSLSGETGPRSSLMPPSPLHLPPIWRESRFGFEAAALLRSRVFKGEDVEDAGGQPVLLIPGFLAGDDSLGLMTQWLRRNGHRTKSAGIRSNVDCSSASVERLAERLECLARTSGQRVAIIDQSRGGNLAKVLAVRYPELVSGIVTLGSPQLDPFDIHPLVRIQVYAVGALGTLGLKGFFKHGCKNGECCERFWEEL